MEVWARITLDMMSELPLQVEGMIQTVGGECVQAADLVDLGCRETVWSSLQLCPGVRV